MRDTQIIRFAAVLAVLSGYVVVFRVDEHRIGERVEENTRIVERIAAAEHALASARALDAERSQLRARLRVVELRADRSAVVARFVRDAARIAAVRHTRIASITSGTAPSRPTAPSATSRRLIGAGAAGIATGGLVPSTNAEEPFDAIPLEMVLDGRYADVLATVRALSAGRVLASVEIASLARKNADAADTTLTAALHVVLQRLAPVEAADVHARPV